MLKKISILIICLWILLNLGACKKVYVLEGDNQLVMKSNGITESDSLDTLFDRARKLVNIRYEILSDDSQTIQRFWLKDKKIRLEADKTVSIYNQDNHLMYIYIPAENKAIKMSLGFGQQPEESIIDKVEDFAHSKPEVIGSEVIDGKNCLVIQYRRGKTMTKAWLWKKYGLPLKIEIDDGKTKTKIAYMNLDFSPIPDNMFELPENVQITDMTNLPDLKDFNLPGISENL